MAEAIVSLTSPVATIVRRPVRRATCAASGQVT
jgi:hypothetical protein